MASSSTNCDNVAETDGGAHRSPDLSNRTIAYDLRHPVRGQKLNLNTCTRLVVFNTANCTVKQFWGELRRILTDREVAQVSKVQRIVNQKCNPRIDVWVKTDIMKSFIKLMRTGTKHRNYTIMNAFKEIFKNQRDEGGHFPFSTRTTSSWRMTLWRSVYDRKSDRPKGKETPKPLTQNIATWNVNGFYSKKYQIEDLLKSKQLAILAIQETKVSDRCYIMSIDGYKSFIVQKAEGFMGQAIFVDNRYPAYEIVHNIKQIIHIKIAGMPQFQKPIHIIAVYLPSGGNFKKQRSDILKKIKHITKEMVQRDPNVIVFVIGDFNISEKEIDTRVAKQNLYKLTRVTPKGSAISRFPIRGKCSAIDHILTSEEGNKFVKQVKVSHKWNASDHRPVIVKIKKGNPTLWEYPKRPLKINNEVLCTKGRTIVNDNRWNLLMDMPTNTLEDMTRLTDSLSETVRSVGMDSKILYYSNAHKKIHMPRKLKSLLEVYKERSKAITKSVETGAIPNKLKMDYMTARRAFRKEKRKVNRRNEKKIFNKMAKDFLRHDYKNVWQKIRTMSGQSTESTLNPVKDKNNKLATGTREILQVIKDHYQAITEYDPQNLSKNKEHWGNIDMEEPPKDELQGLNQEVTWIEIIKAIRSMNRDTSAGKDHMHVNILKMMVREECMAELQQRNEDFRRQEQIQINLPEWELPEQPRTLMGKALYRVLEGVWELGKIPELWAEVYIVNLMKPGDLDPEQMTNYRGISLISCTFKVLLSVMTTRLANAMERENLLVPEQSGFRQGEEAITQFIAIAEVIRGRQVQGMPTYGVFIDFSKAYDRVHHELLYKLLEHYGIRGRFLKLVQSMYNNSKMTVKAGGFFADPFQMHRGNQQGCPLSPLLFIILMNNVFKGDKWPGVYTRTNINRCKGGMYADDVVLLTESKIQATEAADAIYEWGQKWGMDINLAKSAVICFTDNEELLADHQSHKYDTKCGTIPTGEKYKYLGIVIDHRLGFSREAGNGTQNLNNSRSLEKDHARTLAQKGRKVLYSMRPILEDKYCIMTLKAQMLRTLVIPVMTYGAEWFAFKQDHANSSQNVVGKGLQWALGVKTKNESDIFTIGYELGLPVMDVEMARLRTRLIMKMKGEKGLKT